MLMPRVLTPGTASGHKDLTPRLPRGKRFHGGPPGQTGALHHPAYQVGASQAACHSGRDPRSFCPAGASSLGMTLSIIRRRASLSQSSLCFYSAMSCNPRGQTSATAHLCAKCKVLLILWSYLLTLPTFCGTGD